MLSPEQYNRLSFMHNGRRALYPAEIQTVFQIYTEHEGFPAGCTTCPENVQQAIDRITSRINEYQNQIKKETETKVQEDPKPIKLITKKKK